MLRFAPVLLIAAACCALLFQKIDLTNTDLGRHLKNGEILLEGSRGQAAGVLHTNFYSYAAGDYPFVNHHWLAGVVLFVVWKGGGGFEGLTVFYALLVALALAASYWAAQRIANPPVPRRRPIGFAFCPIYLLLYFIVQLNCSLLLLLLRLLLLPVLLQPLLLPVYN